MAIGAGQSSPDLTKAEDFDFFELLRRLERGGRRFGETGGPGKEPALLGQHIRMGFATRDVAEYVPGDGDAPDRVSVSAIGLLGPEGPMPLHLTRWVLDRLSQRWFSGQEQRPTSDTTFVDFANLLQHRMIALFYRAWADATPAVQIERSVAGRVRSMLEAMSGMGLPGTSDGDVALDIVRLRQAASLANQVASPEQLTALVSEAFDVPVRMEEFVAAWVPIPRHLQSRLGMSHAGLGKGATAGARTFSRQTRIELRIGPLEWEKYLSFAPGGDKKEALREVIHSMVGDQIDVDVRLVLAAHAVPKAQLADARLGRTSWFPRAAGCGDAEDMLMRAFVGWRPDAIEARA